jgi:hypothetical protein
VFLHSLGKETGAYQEIFFTWKWIMFIRKKKFKKREKNTKNNWFRSDALLFYLHIFEGSFTKTKFVKIDLKLYMWIKLTLTLSFFFESKVRDGFVFFFFFLKDDHKLGHLEQSYLGSDCVADPPKWCQLSISLSCCALRKSSTPQDSSSLSHLRCL